MEIIQSPLTNLIEVVARNAEHISPKLQDAIADYLRVGVFPPVVMKGKFNAKI